MSFLGGALPDPHERVQQHLTSDLKLRCNGEKTALRFSSANGYAYVGSADLLLKAGRFYQGRVLPSDYEHLHGPSNECYWNALEAAEADPSLRYCEGVYTVGFGVALSHAWCVAPDGEMLELTFPSDPEVLCGALSELGLPFLSPRHWGYYGVTFDVALVRRHADTLGLPMLDRSPAEIADAERKYGPGGYVVVKSRKGLLGDFAEPHDFPLLKVPYDPNRTELP